MAGLRLTDGGLETSLIFDQGLDLPDFAAFPLVESDEGREALRAYFEPYLELASWPTASRTASSRAWWARAATATSSRRRWSPPRPPTTTRRRSRHSLPAAW